VAGIAVDPYASGVSDEGNVVSDLIGQRADGPALIDLWRFAPDHLSSAPDQLSQRLARGRHRLELLSIAERSFDELDVDGAGSHESVAQSIIVPAGE
jgi:hypothetical protein